MANPGGFTGRDERKQCKRKCEKFHFDREQRRERVESPFTIESLNLAARTGRCNLYAGISYIFRFLALSKRQPPNYSLYF